jgi:hypothetical protein
MNFESLYNKLSGLFDNRWVIKYDNLKNKQSIIIYKFLRPSEFYHFFSHKGDIYITLYQTHSFPLYKTIVFTDVLLAWIFFEKYCNYDVGIKPDVKGKSPTPLGSLGLFGG